MDPNIYRNVRTVWDRGRFYRLSLSEDHHPRVVVWRWSGVCGASSPAPSLPPVAPSNATSAKYMFKNVQEFGITHGTKKNHTSRSHQKTCFQLLFFLNFPLWQKHDDTVEPPLYNHPHFQLLLSLKKEATAKRGDRKDKVMSHDLLTSSFMTSAPWMVLAFLASGPSKPETHKREIQQTSKNQKINFLFLNLSKVNDENI